MRSRLSLTTAILLIALSLLQLLERLCESKRDEAARGVGPQPVRRQDPLAQHPLLCLPSCYTTRPPRCARITVVYLPFASCRGLVRCDRCQLAMLMSLACLVLPCPPRAASGPLRLLPWSEDLVGRFPTRQVLHRWHRLSSRLPSRRPKSTRRGRLRSRSTTPTSESSMAIACVLLPPEAALTRLTACSWLSQSPQERCVARPE
jgi:hypothetical protein